MVLDVYLIRAITDHFDEITSLPWLWSSDWSNLSSLVLALGRRATRGDSLLIEGMNLWDLSRAMVGELGECLCCKCLKDEDEEEE